VVSRRAACVVRNRRRLLIGRDGGVASRLVPGWTRVVFLDPWIYSARAIAYVERPLGFTIGPGLAVSRSIPARRTALGRGDSGLTPAEPACKYGPISAVIPFGNPGA
jgi:hypothetical protein